MADSLPPPPSTGPPEIPSEGSAAGFPPPATSTPPTSTDTAIDTDTAAATTSTAAVDTPPAPEGDGRSRKALPFIVIGAILAVVLIVGVIVALVSGSSTDEPYSLDAALDNAANTSSVEYDMTLIVGDEPVFTVVGAVDGDVQRLQVDLGALLGADFVSGSTAEVIIDADEQVVYIQADELIPSSPFDLLLPDLGWFAIDIGELGMDDDDADIAGALSGNPLIVIEAVDSDSSATDLGLEPIDGVETRHYQFTVDVAATVDLPEEITQLVEQFGLDFQIPEGALGEVTYDVWVTEDSQIRRVEIGFEIAEQQLSMVVNIISIGEDVDVEVPSGDDVFDIGELFSF
jgi:hypothetical protein